MTGRQRRVKGHGSLQHPLKPRRRPSEPIAAAAPAVQRDICPLPDTRAIIAPMTRCNLVRIADV